MNYSPEMKKIFSDEKQKSLRLESTRRCVDMIRVSREKGFPFELREALFKLAERVAKMEWGPETLIDDFSEPDFFVITNGRKSKSL